MHRILCIPRKLLETCRLRVRFCPAGIGRRLQRGGKQQKRRLAKSLTGHDCRDRHNSIGADYAESVHNSGKIKDFLRLTGTGQVDVDGSKKIIETMAIAADYHPNHNILIDLRDTTIATVSMVDLLELAVYMARYKSLFENKIASLIPHDSQRLVVAERFRACLQIKGFKYDFFTDFESAIEWLSEPGFPF